LVIVVWVLALRAVAKARLRQMTATWCPPEYYGWSVRPRRVRIFESSMRPVIPREEPGRGAAQE